MENTGLTASDVALMTRNNDGLFGGAGGTIGIFALIIIFILLFGGNGFWGGNAGTALGLADLQASLYNQTQDSNSRALSSSIAGVNDSVITSSYNNLVQMKDMQYQISNSIAGLSNQISNQTATITNLFNEQTIDRLRDQVTVLRGQNSNLVQTAQIDNSIANSTNTILNSLGQWHAYPPCYSNCGCGCNSLY